MGRRRLRLNRRAGALERLVRAAPGEHENGERERDGTDESSRNGIHPGMLGPSHATCSRMYVVPLNGIGDDGKLWSALLLARALSGDPTGLEPAASAVTGRARARTFPQVKGIRRPSQAEFGRTFDTAFYGEFIGEPPSGCVDENPDARVGHTAQNDARPAASRPSPVRHGTAHSSGCGYPPSGSTRRSPVPRRALAWPRRMEGAAEPLEAHLPRRQQGRDAPPNRERGRGRGAALPGRKVRCPR